jgi:hypothetical protein
MHHWSKCALPRVVIRQGTILIGIYKFKYVCKKRNPIAYTAENEEAILLERLLLLFDCWVCFG